MKFTFSIIIFLMIIGMTFFYYDGESLIQSNEIAIKQNSRSFYDLLMNTSTDDKTILVNAEVLSRLLGVLSQPDIDNLEILHAPQPYRQLYPPSPMEPLPPAEELRVVFTPLYRAVLSTEVVVSSVEHIAKRMGDIFTKGDLLIKLDDTVFKGLLIKAKGMYVKAEIALSAKKELFADDIASRFDIAIAESDLASAESEMISAQHAIDQCTILAPYDGQVTNVFVEEYELVQQGKPLMEIINDTSILGKMLIPSYYFNKIFNGQKLTIMVRDANTVVEGKILRIDSAIDPASGMFRVDVEINNQDRKLRAGMIGLTQIKMPQRNENY